MKKRTVNFLLGILIFVMGIYALIQSGARIVEKLEMGFQEKIREQAERTFLPGVHYTVHRDVNETTWLNERIMAFFPIGKYVSDKAVETVATEDSLTYKMILQEQAKDSERMSEDLLDTQSEQAAQTSSTIVSADMSMDKLKDFNYLLSTFYTVDSTTSIGPDQLNAEKLLAKDMHINQKKKGPKVLIFHTHSQETFADSVNGDPNTSIVGMGKYLAEKLNGLGIETMHHDGVYDLINGKLDRSRAYEFSETGVKKILNQYPSIEVVIDLHRDGVAENKHLVTEINGKKTAKIMFFNGLSRTKTNGDIAYLKNPYIQDNLSFSLQMQLASERMYPGLARRIYLKGYRYSLHMMPKSLLIEAGAQTNTVEEMKNAMDLLANILNDVLMK